MELTFYCKKKNTNRDVYCFFNFMYNFLCLESSTTVIMLYLLCDIPHLQTTKLLDPSSSGMKNCFLIAGVSSLFLKSARVMKSFFLVEIDERSNESSDKSPYVSGMPFMMLKKE